MADITLSASVRQSLLSLQNTTNLIEQTQNRLSTGLKVSSAIDDPVAFFSAKTLSDRAGDLLEKKANIDQGVSTVTAALDGVEGIESLVQQMKGIANSMKSATSTQMSDLVSQFNDLRDQIDNFAADSTYQGNNLVNGTGQTLTIEFSDRTASLISISSVDLRSSTGGLNITSQDAYTGQIVATYGAVNGSTTGAYLGEGLTTDQDLTMTWGGPTQTYSAGEAVAFSYGTSSLSFVANSATTLASGDAFVVDIVTAGGASTDTFRIDATDKINFVALHGGNTAGMTASAADEATLTWDGGSRTFTTGDGAILFEFGTSTVTLNVGDGESLAVDQGTVFKFAAVTAAAVAYSGVLFTVGDVGGGAASVAISSTSGTALYGVATDNIDAQASISGRYVRNGDTTVINSAIQQLDTALTSLRTQAQSLGSNVALLSTRLDFTNNYVSTLQTGADKLTLADINEEGANLLALQTRQQLGIQSLSLAAQAESSILRLFN